MVITTFVVNDASVSITMGLPIKKTYSILNTDNLTLKNATNAVVPAVFTVMSRWEALASNSSAPIKWVLIDFIPSGTGEYTLDDSNGSATFPPLTVTDNAGSIQIVTDALDVTIPKSGNALVSSFKISTTEQLTTAKPQLVLPPATTLIANIGRYSGAGGLYGGVGAAAGQKFVQVDSADSLEVGQEVTFEMATATYSYHTTGGGAGVVLQQLGPIWGQSAIANYGSTPSIIFARGTGREFTMTSWTEIYQNQILGTGAWNTQLGNLITGDTVEMVNCVNEPSNTIAAINTGTDVVELTNNLTYDQFQYGRLLAEVDTPMETLFNISTAIVEEENDLRTIIKQSLTCSSLSSHLTVTMRYYFYADKAYVRMRMTWSNASLNENNLPGDIQLLAGAKLRFPTASAVTSSSDSILTSNDAVSRINNSQSSSTAVAGTFKVSVAEFAENFPSKLIASGSETNYEFFPESLGVQIFYQSWVKTWELFIGAGADSGLPLVSRAQVTYNAEYMCESKGVRHDIVPKKTWVTGDFQLDPDITELVESANRAERLLACAYDINVCSSQGDLGGTTRSTLFEWRSGMYGWQFFGNTKDGDTDGWTFNRYDVPFLLLREFIRSGNSMAFRLGTEHARYMADAGTWPSKTPLNESTTYFFLGLSRYERSPALVTGVQTPRPTHSWSEGLWLHWALTGDPLSKAAAELHAARARVWDYEGVGVGSAIDTSLGFNEARGPGWAALELLAAYRYGGNSSDLTLCKQYIDNLRLSEINQGSNGVYVASGYESSPSTGTQPFIWAGYPFVAIAEYIEEKIFQNSPDEDVELFSIRVAKWLAYGDADLSSPGSNAPLVGGSMSGENYNPYGSIYTWYTDGTTATPGTVALGDLCTTTLSTAAFVSGSAALKQHARTVFRDVCFYRDLADGALDPDTRATINFLNKQFPASSAKVWAQTAQLLPDYLYQASIRQLEVVVRGVSFLGLPF